MNRMLLHDNKTIFKFRIGDEDKKGGCTFIGGSWKDVTTDDLFKGKKVVIFGLPGAFTPTCSSQQLPSYEAIYNDDKSDKLCVVLDFQGSKTATNGTFTVSYPNPSTPANAIISMA